MAIALVRSVSFQVDGADTVQVILPSVAAGNFLVVQFSPWNGSPSNNAPTDDKSNTWAITTPPTGQNGGNAFISYAQNVAAGTTTVTVSCPGMYSPGCVSEFSGLLTTGAFDKEAQSGASSATPTCGPTATLAQADELVMVCLGIAGPNGACGIDACTPSYTNLYVEQDAGTHNAGSMDYKIVAATTAVSAAWGTLTGAESFNGKIATFKAAVGGGPPVYEPIKKHDRLHTYLRM